MWLWTLRKWDLFVYENTFGGLSKSRDYLRSRRVKPYITPCLLQFNVFSSDSPNQFDENPMYFYTYSWRIRLSSIMFGTLSFWFKFNMICPSEKSGTVLTIITSHEKPVGLNIFWKNLPGRENVVTTFAVCYDFV